MKTVVYQKRRRNWAGREFLSKLLLFGLFLVGLSLANMAGSHLSQRVEAAVVANLKVNQVSKDYPALISNGGASGLFLDPTLSTSYGSASKYAGQVVKVSAELVSLSNETWVLINTSDGNSYWLQKAAISLPIGNKPAGSTTQLYQAKIDSQGDGLFATISPWSQYVNSRDGVFYGDTVTVTAEYLSTDTNTTWALAQFSDGGTFWLDKHALAISQAPTWSASQVINPTLYQAVISSKTDGLFDQVPANGYVGVDQVYFGKKVTVTAEYTSDTTTWARISLDNGSSFWIDKHALSLYQAPLASSNQTTTSVNYQALVSTKTDGLFNQIPLNGWVGSDEVYYGQIISVTAEYLSGTTTWARIVTANGASFWVDKHALTPKSNTADEAWQTISPVTGYRSDSIQNAGALNSYRYDVVLNQADYYTNLSVGSLLTANRANISVSKGSTVYIRGQVIASSSRGFTGTFYNISFDGSSWYWVSQTALSADPEHTSVSTADSWVYNSFNPSGQIIWRSDSTKFASQVRTATAKWNSLLGKTVFVEAGWTTPLSSINLKIYDVSGGTSYLGQWTSTGLLALNTDILGKGSAASTDTITDTIMHELGHSMGLAHVGDFSSYPVRDPINQIQPWSFGTYTDVMWASNLGDAAPASQSMTTPSEIKAIQLIMANKNYANSTPYTLKSSLLPEKGIR